MVHKNHKYTFEQFNNEINALFNELKLQNFSEKDINNFFKKHLLKERKWSKCQISVIVFVIFIFLLYLLSYFETISWHLSAIGRIFLIKLLPYWDWTSWKNAQCLINQPFNTETKETLFNCNLCENINKIDAYETIDEIVLSQKYIELDVPIILKSGLEFWPKDVDFLYDLNSEDAFHNSYPCSLSTNTQKSESTFGKILENIQLFDNFFVHFQNCELEAMKTFRKYTYRPSFLPNIYSPVTYNWLLWSKNYNTSKFKPIDLIEKITLIGQITGRTYIKLLPRKNCESVCSILEIILEKGESLILTSLWNLEYKAYENGENIAVILEVKD